MGTFTPKKPEIPPHILAADLVLGEINVYLNKVGYQAKMSDRPWTIQTEWSIVSLSGLEILDRHYEHFLAMYRDALHFIAKGKFQDEL